MNVNESKLTEGSESATGEKFGNYSFRKVVKKVF